MIPSCQSKVFSMSSGVSFGDLVWAKMKSYPWWPSVISRPRDDVKKPISKKNMHFVEFFGSNNFAWIADEFIHPFEKYKAEHSNCSSASFKIALNEVNEYISSTLNGKTPKTKTNSPKSNSISGKKRPLKINHSPVKSAKISPVKDMKISPKPKKMLSSPVHTSKKLQKSQLSESSNASSSSKINASDLDSSLPASGLESSRSVSCTSPESVNDTSYTLIPRSNSPYKKFDYREESPPRQPLDNVLKHPSVSDTSNMKIGFIGLGNMGSNIVTVLLRAGHKVTVWSQSHQRLKPFIDAGIATGRSAQDVVSKSDITFSCVTNPQSAKEVVFGHQGVLKAMCRGKGYVEVTSVDPETSRDIAEAIEKKDGKYLEAPVIGTKELAGEGKLIILAAGNSDFFDSCKPFFGAMGEHAFFLGGVGNAAKMNLILSMMMGTSLACLAEAITLAKRVELAEDNLVDIIELCPLSCPWFIEKGRVMARGHVLTSNSMHLNHMQKDMQLALELGDRHVTALPTVAAANEVFKLAQHFGHGTNDVSAVFNTPR